MRQVRHCTLYAVLSSIEPAQYVFTANRKPAPPNANHQPPSPYGMFLRGFCFSAAAMQPPPAPPSHRAMPRHQAGRISYRPQHTLIVITKGHSLREACRSTVCPLLSSQPRLGTCIHCRWHIKALIKPLLTKHVIKKAIQTGPHARRSHLGGSPGVVRSRQGQRKKQTHAPPPPPPCPPARISVLLRQLSSTMRHSSQYYVKFIIIIIVNINIIVIITM